MNLTDPSTSGADVEAKAREAIQRYIHREGITLERRTESWRIGGHRGRAFTSKDLGAQIWVSHSYIPVGVFVGVLKEMAWKLRQAEIDSIARSISPSVPTDRAREELAKFVGLIAHEDTDGERREYYELAIMQLMWQCKRRLAGRPTNTDVMVVLAGGQGTGKSTAIRMFCQPMRFLCVPDGTFRIFSDSFRQGVLESAYLIVLDEMERGSSTDIEAVKRTISSPVLQGRAMHSQTEVSRVRNASFLGATNLSLDAHIRDSTGMRRFVELQFRAAKVSDEWLRAMRGLEWPLVWAAADASLDKAPLQMAAAVVEREQARLVTATGCDLWHEECVTVADPAERAEFRDVYANYLQWCDSYRERPVSRIALGRYMDKRYGYCKPGNIKTYSRIRLSTFSMAKR